MGKRELLLIVAFLVLGGVVYQVSAPDAPAGGEGRSFMDFFRRVRGEMVGARARFPVDLPVKAPVGDDIVTLDLGEIAGRVEVVGEARSDIEGTAVATLLGENEADVKNAASALKLDIETDGDRIQIRVAHPDEWRLGRHSRPAIDLRLKVPSRLAVSLGVTGVVDVQGVSAVKLSGARGSVTVRNIAHEVQGDQRDGMLEITGARSVDVETRRVNLRLEQVTDAVDVEAVDGGLEFKGLAGKTRLNTRRVGIQVDSQTGALEIEGQDGRVDVRGLAAEFTFDGTRLPLRVDMAKPVPVTAQSTDGSVEVRLPAGALTLKIDANEGSVEVPPVLGSPEKDGPKTRFEAKIAGGGPLVSVTGSRSSITVKAP